MHVSLIIPALNESESLGRLLNEVPRDLVHEIIVVDNGSTDNTAEVAQAAGAVVIHEPRRGYGFACAAGTAAAKGDVLVFLDGDGSFVPGEMTYLLAPLANGEADLVLGTRMHANGIDMPPHQRLGNLLFAWLLRQRFGLRLTDLGPYRAVRRELLLKLRMKENTYGWPLEMIIKTARRGDQIVEVPITYRSRFAGVSKVGGTLRGSILAAYRFFYVLFRYAI
jgi:glycosyltransferase involved in cell wall biosynthesis